nr:phospholipase D-like domain-containing protein [uncultured Aminipila sp.]
MNESAFMETLINTLRFDSKYKTLRTILLPILSRSSVNSIPQWAFAIRPGQHWENIELRVPVPLIDTANEHEKEIKDLFEYVYEETDDFALNQVLLKPRIISSSVDELIQNDVIFDEIQDTVIQGIRDAKYLIWVAVAWFTNESFYREMLLKKDAGVNIRVIISDEDSNQNLLPKLNGNFDTVVVPCLGYYGKNRMHDKFCIIDMDYVMHGSYNWTASANYNGETWATAIDREFVKKFADEFMRMYVEHHQ